MAGFADCRIKESATWRPSLRAEIYIALGPDRVIDVGTGGRATVRARWSRALLIAVFLLIAVLKNLQRADLRLLAEIYMALGPDRVINPCIPRLHPSTNLGKKNRRGANAPPVFSER